MFGLDHIAIIISREEHIDFYRQLGFSELQRFERKNDVVVLMTCGMVTLEIFIDPTHPARISSPEANGLRHIAFMVDNFDTIAVECEPVRRDWFGRRFKFCKDPDGQPIELIDKAYEACE